MAGLYEMLTEAVAEGAARDAEAEWRVAKQLEAGGADYCASSFAERYDAAIELMAGMPQSVAARDGLRYNANSSAERAKQAEFVRWLLEYGGRTEIWAARHGMESRDVWNRVDKALDWYEVAGDMGGRR